MEPDAPKIDAYRLITPFIDGECTDRESYLFQERLSQDPKLTQAYRQQLGVKRLLQNRYKKVAMPDSLQAKISSRIRELDQSAQDSPEAAKQFKGIAASEVRPLVDAEQRDRESNRGFPLYYVAMAAMILLTLTIVAIWNPLTENRHESIESLALTHFVNSSGSTLEFDISGIDGASASTQLGDQFGIYMPVPELEGAELEGIALAEFTPGYRTPLFKYKTHTDGQPLFVFGFEMSHLSDFGQLDRDEEAVAACVLNSDFHVRDLDGRHIVSWKWGDDWYTAVSDLPGSAVAAMLPS